MEQQEDPTSSYCDACLLPREPLMKLSLGKDFFGRPYDRLSPASDKSPKWFCESCSTHKILHRDFRDIMSELTPLKHGETSALHDSAVCQQALLRLREISRILQQSHGVSPFLDPDHVEAGIQDLQGVLHSFHSSPDLSST